MKAALYLALCAPLLAGSAWLMRNDARVEQGQEAFSRGEFARAAGLFQEALGGSGNRDVLQFNLGTALAAQGYRAAEPEEASRLLRLARVALRSALDASDLRLRRNAYFNLGSALVWTKDFESAIETYKAILREDPSDDEARYNLEIALLLRDSELSLEDVGPRQGHGGAGTDNAHALGARADGQGAGTPSEGQSEGGASTELGKGAGDGLSAAETSPGDSNARAMRAEPRPMREAESVHGRGIEEKLEALERRSGELRRGRVLRRTRAMRQSRRQGAK